MARELSREARELAAECVKYLEGCRERTHFARLWVKLWAACGVPGASELMRVVRYTPDWEHVDVLALYRRAAAGEER